MSEIKVGQRLLIQARIVGSDFVYEDVRTITPEMLEAVEPSEDGFVRFARWLLACPAWTGVSSSMAALRAEADALAAEVRNRKASGQDATELIERGRKLGERMAALDE